MVFVSQRVVYDRFINLYCLFFLWICYFLMMFSDYGVDKYDIGTGFGHFGIAVEDVSSPLLFPNILFAKSDYATCFIILHFQFQIFFCRLQKLWIL